MNSRTLGLVAAAAGLALLARGSGCTIDPPTPGPVAGPRMVVLLHETADKSPEWTRAINLLRVGPQAQYLSSKGHSLLILDDDSVGADGKPSPAVARWLPHVQGLDLPVLIVADKATGGVTHKQSLPDAVTADGIVEIIKSHGG